MLPQGDFDVLIQLGDLLGCSNDGDVVQEARSCDWTACKALCAAGRAEEQHARRQEEKFPSASCVFWEAPSTASRRHAREAARCFLFCSPRTFLPARRCRIYAGLTSPPARGPGVGPEGKQLGSSLAAMSRTRSSAGLSLGRALAVEQLATRGPGSRPTSCPARTRRGAHCWRARGAQSRTRSRTKPCADVFPAASYTSDQRGAVYLLGARMRVARRSCKRGHQGCVAAQRSSAGGGPVNDVVKAAAIVGRGACCSEAPRGPKRA